MIEAEQPTKGALSIAMAAARQAGLRGCSQPVFATHDGPEQATQSTHLTPVAIEMELTRPKTGVLCESS